MASGFVKLEIVNCNNKMKNNNQNLANNLPIPIELIERRIYFIRGQKVMVSSDLAEIYHVEPRVLVQSVKRNLDRFPKDFMFQLSNSEYAILKSQFVISSWGGSRRANPYAFTEQGVAMLSSVLKSKRAIAVNIFIMRAFVRLREIMATHKDLAAKMEKLEAKQQKHSKDIAKIFGLINLLLRKPEKPMRRIGFA